MQAVPSCPRCGLCQQSFCLSEQCPPLQYLLRLKRRKAKRGTRKRMIVSPSTASNCLIVMPPKSQLAPCFPILAGPYKDTVNLPQTSFNMRANSVQREPQIQKFWQDNKVYESCLQDEHKVGFLAGRALQHSSINPVPNQTSLTIAGDLCAARRTSLCQWRAAYRYTTPTIDTMQTRTLGVIQSLHSFQCIVKRIHVMACRHSSSNSLVRNANTYVISSTFLVTHKLPYPLCVLCLHTGCCHRKEPLI